MHSPTFTAHCICHSLTHALQPKGYSTCTGECLVLDLSELKNVWIDPSGEWIDPSADGATGTGTGHGTDDPAPGAATSSPPNVSAVPSGRPPRSPPPLPRLPRLPRWPRLARLPRWANVSAGLVNGELYSLLEPLNRTVVSGTCFPVGLAGLALGGGAGVLMRMHGLACDQMLAFQVHHCARCTAYAAPHTRVRTRCTAHLHCTWSLN